MTPRVGEPAPDFALRDQHGRQVALSSYRREKAVVMMFYPYAFSSVCTGELADVRDHLATFQNDRTQVLAISCDPVYTLRAFADRDGLAFPLLSDFWPHGAVASAYGAFDDERGSSDRATFIVDRDGLLRWSVRSPRADARDLEEQARVLAGLSGATGADG